MKKLMILFTLTLLGLSLMGAHVVNVEADIEPSTPSITDGNYYSILSSWKNEVFSDNSGFILEITPSDFEGVVLNPLTEKLGYKNGVYDWTDDSKITVNLNVPSTGLYQISLDFYSLSDDYLDLEMAVKINGEYQYLEMQQIILYKLWRQDESFTIDRYGNDFFGSQTQELTWIHQDFFDPMGLFAEPLLFKLNAGLNTLELTRVKGDVKLGNITVKGEEKLLSYSEYSMNKSLVNQEVLLEYEAEIPDFKNSSNIQPAVSRTVNVTPYSVRQLKLNTISGSTYNAQREMVTYQIEAPEEGYYYLSWKVLQSTVTNGVIFRTLRINGVVPFKEAYVLPIEYNSKWQNVSFGGEEPYLFYFNEGINTVSLSVSLSPYQNAYYEIDKILDYINNLSLKIKKLTGNQLDEDRDWKITDFLPDIVTELTASADRLAVIQNEIASLSETEKLSETESLLKIAIRNLRFLAEKPNDIPKNISLLSTSSNSIASTLGNVIGILLNSPLDIDKFYLHTDTLLPKPNANFIVRFWVSIKRFFLSFFDKRFVPDTDGTELTVWVNRNKQYVDLIQKMVDEDFTKETGIKVNVSVMAAEGKLILANSAGKAPDVALGVSSWLPFDMGVRGAIMDLSVFSGDPEFAQTLSYFQTESLIPFVYDEGLYGLPDTENFYALFYRTDILNALDIPVPDTWEDVKEIMPILKRYGMNFYLPLSSGTSLKAFDATLPFLFQYGSDIYEDNAFAVSLDNPESVSALETMTELYTIYSMDVTVSSFYNDFRLGLSPIGVGDFGMYITLLNAAPDIQGLWKIALLPGVDHEGVIDRSAPGAQTANMIFKNTEKPDESWAFLKWWASTETQISFTSMLLSTFGKEYLWNSANTAAFNTLNIQENDIDIILEQWSHLRELPKVPGNYQVELEISNLWNSVVIDRANVRVLLNDGIIKMNREIAKKMAEFGYMDKKSNILKPYVIANTSLIEDWKQGD